jgi:hypothetical protein
VKPLIVTNSGDPFREGYDACDRGVVKINNPYRRTAKYEYVPMEGFEIEFENWLLGWEARYYNE